MRRHDRRRWTPQPLRTRALLAPLGLVAVLALAVPLAAGVRAHPTDAGSTGHTLRPGSGVITVPIEPREVAVGDLVSFPAPGDGRVVTERVVGVEVIGAIAAVETRRDGAAGTEHWQVAAEGRIGRVVGQVPLLGHVLGAITSTAGGVLLLGAPALGLAALAVTPRSATDRRGAEPVRSGRRSTP
jgi:hypothetical protein